MIAQFDACAALHKLKLNQFAIYHLLHHKTQTQVRRIVVANIHQTSVDLRVYLFEEVNRREVVGNGNERAQIQSSAVRHALPEGNP